MRTCRSIAIDLGAESCRVSLGEWDGTRAEVRLVHRFANGAVERGGHLYWDLDRLWQGAEQGLRLSAELATSGIDSIGVDGWAVDYVRLDAAGKVLDQPFCYRDRRTESVMEEVWARMGAGASQQGPERGKERLYQLTGIQFLRFNTLYQLYADRRDRLEPGARWLNIPEYLLYRLGGAEPGAAVAEYTNATHTQLVDVRSRNWSDEIFERAGLDRSAAPSMVRPGTKLGALKGVLASLPAYRATQLIAPACHDTGSAVAGIPDSGSDWAFISSGTWSLVGAVLDEPCTTPAALRENFTNEGGVGGRIRFLKNVNGMWLLQECMREWTKQRPDLTLSDLLTECEQRPRPQSILPVDAPDLLLPGNMPARINRELESAGYRPIGGAAENAGEMANVIFFSLAARYAQVLRALGEVTGRRFRRLYVVGGGSQNVYLNRLIQEHTGIELLRGPAESSTIGNLAIQFAALEAGDAAVTPDRVAAWAARFGQGSEVEAPRSGAQI